MTFNSFRIIVQQIILDAYSDSSPQVILLSTGIFNVYIKGEVKTAGFLTCWGLSRFTEVIQEKTTNFSSIRNITIISSDGITNEYDLFTAMRYGEKEQDPYLKPDDTIIIEKYDRLIKVTGEVFRPGAYQLMDGEDLIDLIMIYADGFTTLSDTSSIQIMRYNSENTGAGEMLYIDDSSSLFQNFVLQDLDEVYIPNRNENLPVVYFEGAIESNIEVNNSMAEMSNKVTYYFVQGEKLSSAILQNYDLFSQYANLREAYIIRIGEDEPIPVNIEDVIHNNNIPENDIPLMQYDRIIIPYEHYYVSVIGAVIRPGQYPYVPNRNYLYYLNLAGGTDPEKNINEGIRITDINGEKQSTIRIIQPEDIIYARFNSPLYQMNRWAVVIGTSVSVSLLIITIIQLNR